MRARYSRLATAMELNALYTAIKDMQQRIEALRGYL